MSDTKTNSSRLKIIGSAVVAALIWVLEIPIALVFLSLLAVVFVFWLVVNFITHAACLAFEAFCYLIALLVAFALLAGVFYAVHWCFDREFPVEKIEEVK